MSEDVSTTGGTPTAAPAAVAAAQVQAPTEVQTAAADAKVAPAGVPEKYDLKPIEGYQYDAAAFEKFARARGLDNQGAQDFLAFQAEQASAFESARSEAWETKQKQWGEAIAADKDLGGANLQRTQANVDRVFSKIDPAVAKEARELFKVSGLGNHPALVRLFNYLGSHMEDDGVSAGGSPTASGDLAQRMNFNFGIGPK